MLELELDPLAGRRRKQPVSAAAERLQVVADDRPALESHGEPVEARAAADDPLALGSSPALAVDRQRDAAVAEVVGRPLDHLDLELRLDPASRDRLVLLEPLLEPFHHRPQLELAHELAQGAAVGPDAHHLAEVDSRLDVEPHRRELLGDPGIVGVLDQILLAFRAGYPLDIGEDLLERAELLQQLGGGLVADPGDAGDVVGGVAFEPDQVGYQLRRHPVALDHAVAVVDLGLGDSPRGGHHPDSVAHQLVDVAVAGDDHHRDPLLLCAARQRPDHVVGLVALGPDVGVSERLDQRHHVRPLLAQEVGPRRALRLVGLVRLIATRHSRVPGRDQARRLVLDDDFPQHRGEPVDRVRRPPVGGRDRLRQREERPVGERVPVEEKELVALSRRVGCHRQPLYEARQSAFSFRRRGMGVKGSARLVPEKPAYGCR